MNDKDFAKMSFVELEKHCKKLENELTVAKWYLHHKKQRQLESCKSCCKKA